jgi:hypothetical protein
MDESDSRLSITDLVETWRSIIVGEGKSWVLFENGTCVVLSNATGDIEKQAIDLLAEWGPVQVATPSADFNVVDLVEHPGWVVTCHHPDILTYVGPEEMGPQPAEIMIGLIGRGKRDRDAHDLKVVHVEQTTA